MKKFILPFVVLYLLFGLALTAYSAPPVVKTVPWTSTNPLIPHDTWSGKNIALKGTSDVQGSNIQYTWDFGDGSPVVTGTVSNRYVIEAWHTYTGNKGDLFTARLTVQNTSTLETGSKEYYVQIRDKDLDTEVNVAIDEGLWYLHKTMYRYSISSVDYGRWDSGCGGYACIGYAAINASNINAFEVNGNLESGDSDNPYTETVVRGMRQIFTQLTRETISLQIAGNPDSNGNGYGVRVNQSYYPYQGGMFMDAIIASGTPDAVTTTGQTPGILGRKYKDIVQDMVDSYAYGQYDSGLARGGWRYGWNEWPDNSACQWAAIGIIPAEREWGLTVPLWLKTENLIWLGYSQSTNGACGYTDAGYFPWGPYATTPSCMVQFTMDGIGRGDTRWDKVETYIRDRYGNTGGPGSAIKDYYYGLFSFVKSMFLHDSNGDGVVDPTPSGIVMLQSQTPDVGPIDWYKAEASMGDPTDGVARTLVGDQNPGGYWFGHNVSGTQYYFETAWAIMMLRKSIGEIKPVAKAEAIPNPGLVGQTITLDGSDSYHNDTSKGIDSWDWDFDNDGVCDDASGPIVTNSWPALGNYPVMLCVSDNGVGAD